MAEQNPPVMRAEAAGAEGEPRSEPDITPGRQPDSGPGSGPAEQPRSAAAWRPAPHSRQAYAAIDLGTNNCRLLIARPSGENFAVVDAFSRVVRLGEGLAQTGLLSQEAMDRAVGALRICADKLKRRNVHLARSVATEACRRAANGEDFIERVRQETGIALDIISAREEARLAVLGCHILLEAGNGPAMIFDIGGGSTELVLIESTDTVPRILDWQSVPWGVVSLTETFGPEGASRDERIARYAGMRDRVADSFAEFADRVAGKMNGHGPVGTLRLLGTSGTVTTLASLHLDLPQYDRRAVDGLIVPAESMREHQRDALGPVDGRAPAARLHRQGAGGPGGRGLRHPRGDSRSVAGRPARRRRPRHPRRHPAQPDLRQWRGRPLARRSDAAAER